MSWTRHAALVLALSLLMPRVVTGQSKSHGYIDVGAGATDLSGGGEWVHRSGFGVEAELGVGWVFLGAVNASFHPFSRRVRRHDVFATAGYMSLNSSEFSSRGVSVGGGAVYWLGPRIGLRFDAFKFLPVATDNNIRVEERSPSRYWGIRGGVAFGF
jgi:hypothetical protein